MYAHSKKESGFTLIELIVVVGMMSALSGFFVMNSAGVRNAQRLDLGARQVVSVLREAQAMGAGGKAYPAGATDTTPSTIFDKGYGVYMTADSASDANTKVLLYGGEGDGVEDPDVSPPVDKPAEDKYEASRIVTTNTLPPGVVVQGITAKNATGGPCTLVTEEVSIHTRRGEVQTNIHVGGTTCENASEVTITLESATGDTKMIVVNKAGLIYVQ